MRATRAVLCKRCNRTLAVRRQIEILPFLNMVELTPSHATWPADWRRRGGGTDPDESFADWFARLDGQLPDLHAEAYEQWVYKHWDQSDYFGLPLARMTSALTSMSTENILRDVGVAPGSWGDPDRNVHSDIHRVHLDLLRRRTEPVNSMMTLGTWNFPLLVIRSSSGFRYKSRSFRSPLWLIEGHYRLRCLKVLSTEGELSATHTVVELSYA